MFARGARYMHLGIVPLPPGDRGCSFSVPSRMNLVNKPALPSFPVSLSDPSIQSGLLISALLGLR